VRILSRTRSVRVCLVLYFPPERPLSTSLAGMRARTLALNPACPLVPSFCLAHSISPVSSLSVVCSHSLSLSLSFSFSLFLSFSLSLFLSFSLSLSLSLPHTRAHALSLARALCIRYILYGYSNSALSHTQALSRSHTHALIFPCIRYILCGYENWVLSHIISLSPTHTIHLFCIRYMLCGYADGAISITDVEDTPRGAHTKFETVMARTHAQKHTRGRKHTGARTNTQ